MEGLEIGDGGEETLLVGVAGVPAEVAVFGEKVEGKSGGLVGDEFEVDGLRLEATSGNSGFSSGGGEFELRIDSVSFAVDSDGGEGRGDNGFEGGGFGGIDKENYERDEDEEADDNGSSNGNDAFVIISVMSDFAHKIPC